jgi:hypothetical protein
MKPLGTEIFPLGFHFDTSGVAYINRYIQILFYQHQTNEKSLSG